MVKRVRGSRTGPADHGAARPAGPALGAAHRLGAARGAQALPRAAGPDRRQPDHRQQRGWPTCARRSWSSWTTAAGYRLTALGEELLRLFLPLHLWSEKWAKAVLLEEGIVAAAAAAGAAGTARRDSRGSRRAPSGFTGGMRCFSSIRSKLAVPEVARQALRLDQRHAVAGGAGIEGRSRGPCPRAGPRPCRCAAAACPCRDRRRRPPPATGAGGTSRLAVLAQTAPARSRASSRNTAVRVIDDDVRDRELHQDSTSTRMRLIGLAP